MEKLKQALEKCREQLDTGYWFAGGEQDIEEAVQLLEEGIKDIDGMGLIRTDHEAIRNFVQRETGGYVERIVSGSYSDYAPTLSSQSQEVTLGRRIAFRLKENPTFLPTHYTAWYKVTVVYPPGERYEEIHIDRVGDTLRIEKRIQGTRW